MGLISSLQRSNVEEVDIAANSAYRYPPKSGCYFGSHFSMGGQRFETPQPESYLFGENSDLNYLGSRPATFPYPSSNGNEPTETLKSLVNIRKDSLRLAKVMREADESEDATEPQDTYSIEFTFDSEARTAITIYFFATEEIHGGKARYTARSASLRSETFHYDRGANQQFYQPAFTFSPGNFNEADFIYDPLKECIPVVIQCVVEEGEEHTGHCHTLLGTFEMTSEGTYAIKPLKQKQMVEGVYYLLQEIYGIENKNGIGEPKSVPEDDDPVEDNSDCAICLSDPRDTLILPCRHLCLCNTCADNLRYQASACPICRAPFRALLQIRALRKVNSPADIQTTDENQVSQENVPPGYQAIPLGEALNGPSQRPVVGAEGGVSTAERPSTAGGEGRSKKSKRKHRTSSANSNRSRQATAEATREERQTKKEQDLKKDKGLVVAVPVDVLDGTDKKVETVVVPLGNDEGEQLVVDIPPVYESKVPPSPEHAVDALEAGLASDMENHTEDDYGRDDPNNDSSAVEVPAPPMSIVYDEVHDEDVNSELHVPLSTRHSSPTWVDMELPGTPLSASLNGGNSGSVTDPITTPSSIQFEGDETIQQGDVQYPATF